MEKELREKMQEKAKELYPCTNENPCGDREKRLSCDCGHLRVMFIAGANTLYSELKPKIEWVDVNERLPEIKERDYQIVVKFYSEVFKEFWVTDSLEYDFDALGVKFWREI